MIGSLKFLPQPLWVAAEKTIFQINIFVEVKKKMGSGRSKMKVMYALFAHLVVQHFNYFSFSYSTPFNNFEIALYCILLTVDGMILRYHRDNASFD